MNGNSQILRERMRSLHNSALRAAGILLLVIQIITSHHIYGQQIWPGDVNNNGIVNGVDLLYHGVAEGKTGSQRLDDGTNWVGHPACAAWSDSFADGINYSYADANGRGKVDRHDRRTIWEENYGMTHGTVTPDFYSTGSPANDPVLQLLPKEEVVYPGDVLGFSLLLGDAQHVITDFFAITFTLSFDPAMVKEETTAPSWNPNVTSLSVQNANWPSPTTGNKLESFIQLNHQNGELEVVIMREALEVGSGHGEIASIMVIIEDVVMLEDVNTTFTVSKIKLIDDNMVSYPIAGSSETITVAANSSAYTINTTRTDQETTQGQTRNNRAVNTNDQWPVVETSTRNEDFNIRVFPNPVVNKLRIESIGKENDLAGVQLFSTTGQLLKTQQPNSSNTAEVDMTNLPKGNYFLQLTTSNGTTVKQVNK
jgi:hypothetical protein